ncbi:hypothetical protein LguiA_009411 [Lonicera macranthoides]
MMRWQKLLIETRHGDGGGSGGPGKRWGHTCNAVRGGKLLYVFGGYGKDNCQTNQVHVFETAQRTWCEPVMKGILPTPRDSHSCTTVGDNLFVFGGTDGKNPLRDLHILDTASNTWISPNLRGEGPEAREGHSAALIGKRLFIFGGCGKSSYRSDEEYYDDLYILNTETFVWKRAETSGTPPAKRDSHTCTSWKNKIIVIGGEDSHDYYLSDVHILDTDTLIWGKLNTSGQLLPPRAGHTTVALGRNMFVFGGFTDEQNLYDDIYMLDVDAGLWTKVMATGEGPSARFSMAGDCLDPQEGGVLAFVGGCNKNLEALDDMYYLYTGLSREIERDDRRLEKLSLRKQLKLKCQEQHALTPVYDKALVRVETTNANIYHPGPMPSFIQPTGRQNVYLNEYQTPLQGKKMFQANITKSMPDGYTIETVIDGKPLRGILFSNKPASFNSKADDDSVRKRANVDIGGAKSNENHNSNSENARSSPKQDERKADGVNGAEVQNQAVTTSDMKSPMASDASRPLEAPVDIKLSVTPDTNLIDNERCDAPQNGTVVTKENTSDPAKDYGTSLPNQDDRALTTEVHNPLIENPPAQSV